MTLVEIMIVVVIVATMGTVIVNAVRKQLDKARVRQAQILITEVGKSLDQFYTDCGFFPTTDQGLQALLQAPAGRTCTNWGPDAYVKKLPKDPWNHELAYTSDGTKYTLKSFGADGQEGGSGIAADISSEE